MQERIKQGVAGLEGSIDGRDPDAWARLEADGLASVAELVAGRAFLYDDPPSFRAGVRELWNAVRDALSRGQGNRAE